MCVFDDDVHVKLKYVQQRHVVLWFDIIMINWFPGFLKSDSLTQMFFLCPLFWVPYQQWKKLRHVHRHVQFVFMRLSLSIKCYYVFFLFPISLRFCVQHCFLERSWCQRGCGCFWTLTAGRRPQGGSWGAHTSCQQREPSFSPHTASFSKASPMIHWVNTREPTLYEMKITFCIC